MKRFLWLVVCVVPAVLIAAPAALAEEAKAKPAKEKAPAKASSGLKGEYAIMASECKLPQDQIATLKAKVQAKDEALAAWEKENGEKAKAIQEAAKKAREGNDKAASKKAADDLKALNEAKAKIQADGMVAIYAVLTPEQKQTWDGFVLYRSMMARFKKVNPTDEQQGKIRALCADAAKEIAAVTGDEKAAAKAKNTTTAKLVKTIEETVLTAAQREELAKKPAPKPAAEKPAAGKKPAEPAPAPAAEK
jgi:Spy/CpxP family protein refolding chaperone